MKWNFCCLGFWAEASKIKTKKRQTFHFLPWHQGSFSLQLDGQWNLSQVQADGNTVSQAWALKSPVWSFMPSFSLSWWLPVGYSKGNLSIWKRWNQSRGLEKFPAPAFIGLDCEQEKSHQGFFVVHNPKNQNFFLVRYNIQCKSTWLIHNNRC